VQAGVGNKRVIVQFNKKKKKKRKTEKNREKVLLSAAGVHNSVRDRLDVFTWKFSPSIVGQPGFHRCCFHDVGARARRSVELEGPNGGEPFETETRQTFRVAFHILFEKATIYW